MEFINGITPVPMEVLNYFMEHIEDFYGVPLNADTCNKIWKILHQEENLEVSKNGWQRRE